MKSPVKQFGIIAIFLIFLAGCGPSAVVVRSRPETPVYVRPIAPRPNYIWIDGDWMRRSNGYVYRHGYWAQPRARHHQYREGHWQQRRGGWYWAPGRWN